MNRSGSPRRKNGITRRAFTRAAAAAGVSAVAAMSLGPLRIARAAAPDPARPNIILFIADDMRYDAAGFAGNPVIRTPNLDALASRSANFSHCFVTTSICCSSRASIMTGLHSQSHGVYDFQESLRQEHLDSMFPALLRAQGYHTGYVGKWGIGREPTNQFDRWMGYAGQGGRYRKRDGHLTDIQTHQALDFLRTRPHARPFLLIVSYKAAHGPQQPQRRFAHLYRDTVFPRSPTDPAHPDKPAVALPQMLETYSRHTDRYREFIGTDAKYQRFMRNYYQVLTGMDESLGLILGELEQLGLSDSTAVLFTSDNGHMLGEHGLYGKSYMYEESIRVPLLIAPAPGLHPEFQHRVIATPALNIDIAPTLLSLAGFPQPPAMQGMDMLAVVLRPETPTRTGWYYEGPHLPQHSVLCEGYRTLDWKYVRYFTPDRSQLQECLYDLAADPDETSDLAPVPGHARRLSRMRRQLLAERDRLSRA